MTSRGFYATVTPAARRVLATMRDGDEWSAAALAVKTGLDVDAATSALLELYAAGQAQWRKDSAGVEWWSIETGPAERPGREHA